MGTHELIRTGWPKILGDVDNTEIGCQGFELTSETLLVVRESFDESRNPRAKETFKAEMQD